MLAGYGTATGAFGATVAATQGVTDDEQGLAGGLVNMSRQVGAALGVAVAAAIIGTGVSSGGSVAPDRSAVLVTAAAAVLAAALALRGIGARARAAPTGRPASGPLASERVDSTRVEATATRRLPPRGLAPLFSEFRRQPAFRREGARATIAGARSASRPRKE
jgi:hypothetical protein